MNYKDAVRRIGVLEDKHINFNCPGCSICTEIKKLGMFVRYSPKVGEILSKGEDMTKSEVKYLLEKDVNRREIASALNMGLREFVKWWFQYSGEIINTPTKGKKREHSLTVQEYLGLQKQKYTDKEIADLNGITAENLYQWKVANKDKLGIKELGSFRKLKLTRDEYIELFTQGVPHIKMAEMVKTNRTTLVRWVRENFSAKELEQLKPIHLAARRSKYKELKHA